MSCLVCNRSPVDRCHIKTRGSGGSNDDWNLVTMCRVHHTESHQLGWFRFAEKYPIVGKELRRKGWEFVDRFGLMKLVRRGDG